MHARSAFPLLEALALLHFHWVPSQGTEAHVQTSLPAGGWEASPLVWLQFWEEPVWVGSKDCAVSHVEDFSRAASLLW